MTPNPYDLARELARPVARGYLGRGEAYATMLAGTVRADRQGKLAPYKAGDVFAHQAHIFRERLERLEIQRGVTELRIKRRIKPLLAMHKPRNVVLAEAHDVNGAAGFPFDESDVNTIATTEMYWAMQRRPVHA